MTATTTTSSDLPPGQPTRPRRRRPRLGVQHHARAAATALATYAVLTLPFPDHDPLHPLVFFAAAICLAASRNRVRQLAAIHVALIAIALTLTL